MHKAMVLDINKGVFCMHVVQCPPSQSTPNTAELKWGFVRNSTSGWHFLYHVLSAWSVRVNAISVEYLDWVLDVATLN